MKIILISLMIALSYNAYAQVPDQISDQITSGRPGQSIGSGTIGNGIFQIQSGIDLLYSEIGTQESSTRLFNNVFRFGLTNDFELSAVVNYQSDEFKQAGVSTSQDGISTTQVGFRNRVIKDSDGLIPSMAIQTRFKLKTVDKEYRNNNLAPVITFSFGHGLNEEFSLTHNLGVSYSGSSTVPTYFATSNLSHALGQDYGWFIEVYGNMTNDIGGIYINAGGDYYLNSDLKLDISFGWGNNQSTDTFVSLGFSWRTF